MKRKNNENSPEIKQILELMEKTGTSPAEIIEMLQKKLRTIPASSAKANKLLSGEFLVEVDYDLGWKKIMSTAQFSQIARAYKKSDLKFNLKEKRKVQAVGKFLEFPHNQELLEIADVSWEIKGKWKEANIAEILSINKLLKNGLGSTLENGTVIVATGSKVGKSKGWYDKLPAIRFSKTGNNALEILSADQKINRKIKILVIRK